MVLSKKTQTLISLQYYKRTGSIAIQMQLYYLTDCLLPALTVECSREEQEGKTQRIPEDCDPVC